MLMERRSVSEDPSRDIASLSDEALRQNAQENQLAGNHESAIAFYEEAARRHPGHPGILLGLLQCCRKLRRMDQFGKLVAVIRDLVRQEPALIDQFGEELQKLHEYGPALETFSLLGRFPQAEVRAVGLARETALHLRLGQESQAREAIAAAERLAPQLPEVLSAKALLCRKSDPEEARRILTPLSHPNPRIPLPFTVASAHSLAAVCDSLNLPDEAMEALARGKALEQQQALVKRFRSQRQNWWQWHLDALDFNRTQAGAWAEAHDDGAHPRHAFLLGHPRSGTTLLEQMLDAHPAIQSVEESDIYSTAIDTALLRLHGLTGGTMPFADWVRSLPEAELDPLRHDYFRKLAVEAGRPMDGLIALDKNPGLTMSVPRFARTLPATRLIIMLRDPRDVCLSAYFQSINRTPLSVNWLTLEETVEQYAFTMNLWLKTREIIVQPWIEVRYEDVVREATEEGTRVTRFLGLDWHAAQNDPAGHARRKLIKSPTHADVVQPIHPQAVGRWRRYEQHLAPFQSKLAPFCEAFGYDV